MASLFMTHEPQPNATVVKHILTTDPMLSNCPSLLTQAGYARRCPDVPASLAGCLPSFEPCLVACTTASLSLIRRDDPTSAISSLWP